MKPKMNKPIDKKKSWNEILEKQWAYQHKSQCLCKCHCPNVKEDKECDFSHNTSCVHCN